MPIDVDVECVCEGDISKKALALGPKAGRMVVLFMEVRILGRGTGL